MKTSTILILIGSVALVGTASFFAYKKYSEKKSGIDGGCGCGCSEKKSNYLDTGGGGGISGVRKGKANLM